MQFIDLKAQQNRIRKKIDENIRVVLDHGSYIMGPEIKTLEDRLAAYVNVDYAISCSSGTDALLMALLAYQVCPGDAIFTTPFTFVATAEVISLLGATPIFVDIDPNTFTMDPEKLLSAVSKLNRNPEKKLNTKGVIPVDIFGLPADYDRINAIAKEYNLFVIQDAAQSFGADYHGKKSCSHADIGCTSFFPAKPLGCYGDGGMCFTNNKETASVMKSIRIHGQGNHKYENIRIGINGRMDTLQSAILLAKFDIFPEEIELRQVVANRYRELLFDTPAIGLQTIPDHMKSVWAQFSILAKDEQHRSCLMDALNKEGIPTAIYYPKPLHLQEAFSSLGYSQGDFPISESVSKRIFSLPMHPYLDADSQKKIVRVLKEAI